MHRTALNALLAILFVASLLVPGTSAQTKLARIDFRDRTLPNGLRVLSVEDHSSPTVCIEVWYHVGSKDDPDGRSGFAHLFEHIMFKATKHMKDEMLDRLTEDVGGFNNAFTADDKTVYYEVVPSNYLETLLWAEADRLSSLTVNDKNFLSERDVVKEEYRQSYLADPYGMLYLANDKKSWTAHPYKRPGIGNIEELNAATIEDVKAFHATYYRPDNATVVVVGDFDPKQLDTWVDRYFAGIPKPAGAIPRVTIKEPARTSEARYDVTGADVPLPAIIVNFLVPGQTSEDAFALSVLSSILSSGESSRLYQSLVYEKQVASEATSSADLREDAGLFVVQVTLASGKTLPEVEAAVDEQLKKIQDTAPSPAELDKAKNQLVTAKLLEYETNNGKADALGLAAVILGDPNRINTDIVKLQAVTAADVQRVAKKYFEKNNRVVLNYTAAPEAPKEGAGK